MCGNYKLACFALAWAGVFGIGCAKQSAIVSAPPPVISEYLLFDLDAVETNQLSADDMMMSSPDWEALVYSRNDDRLGSDNGGAVATVEWLEIRQRDFQRTVNGKPREYSTTYTRTTRRGFVH